MYVDDIIRLNAKHQGGVVGVTFEGQNHTYKELNNRINVLANALSNCDVSRGDVVAVLGKNSLEYFLLYFAIARVGALLTPLSYWFRESEHTFAISDSDPKLIFVEPDLLPSLGKAKDGRQVVLLPSPSSGVRSDWDRFLGASSTTPFVAEGRSEDDPHMILYTSGTTGQPKGALLSHRRTMQDAFTMSSSLGVRGDDVFINYFPPFHVGNWDHMKLFLVHGARVVLMRQFDAAVVLDMIADEQVTVILGVPAMLHDLMNQPKMPTADLSSLRMLYYGAYDPSGIMSQIADRIGARSGKTAMAHTYGLTEAGPFVTLCRPHEILEKWGSIGRPIPGVEVALLDDHGNEVGEGDAGEICVRGPMMSGYWNRPDASAEALAGGWLHTGDVGVCDEDGFYWIVDRKKDMIRTGGQNVYSKQIEDLLQSHLNVVEAAVIGLPDEVYEENVCAIIVLREGVVASPEVESELQDFVRQNLAGYNTPKVIHFVDEIPRNAVGKAQKHLLRDGYGSMFQSKGHGENN